jgi:hypothetical protein
MANRIAVVPCVVAWSCMVTATGVLAQCGAGYLGLDLLLPQESVAIVFSGTVASVERAGPTETVTFDVDRVWKGFVSQRITIYRPIPVAPSPPKRSGGGGIGPGEFTPTIFKGGDRYVVVAHSLSVTERKNLGLADREETLGTDICGGGSRPFAVAEQELATLGQGRPPTPLASGPRRPR